MQIDNNNIYLPRPDVGSVSRLFLVLFIVVVTAGGTLQYLHFETGMAVTQWVLVLLPALWYWRRYRVDRVTFARLRPLPGGFVPVIILLAASFWVINMVFAMVLVYLLTKAGYHPVQVLVPPETLAHYLTYLFVLAFSAGVCEEVFFRGTVMPAAEQHGQVPALVFSSLLFAVVHGSFINLPSAFVLGILIGLVVIKTGSLWGGVLYHMVNNFFAVTFLYASTFFQEEELTGYSWLLAILLFLALAGAVYGLKSLQEKSGAGPLLAGRTRWLPPGWLNWPVAVSLLLFVVLASLILAQGFGLF